MSNFKNAISKFHNDERGLEALQTVMILAVAAVALIAVKTQWTTVKSFFDDNMGDATSGWEGQASGGAGGGAAGAGGGAAGGAGS